MLMPGAAGLSAVGAVGAPGPDELVSGLGALAGATPQQKDTTWTKLFVGGLPYHTTDKSLREHFSVYGDIEEAVVITDRQTGKSRGYGFVIMGDRAAAERACKDPNPIIDGRKANVNLAILGAKPRGNLQTTFPFAAGIRAGYPAVLPGQYGVPPSYVYQSPYLAAAAPGGLVPLPATQLSHAAAVAATQFYDYQNVAAAAATYPGTSYNFAEAYPYTSAAAAGTLENLEERKDFVAIYHYYNQQNRQDQQDQQDRQDRQDQQDRQDRQDHQDHQDHLCHQNHYDYDSYDYCNHYCHHCYKHHDFYDKVFHDHYDKNQDQNDYFDDKDDLNDSDYIAYLKYLDFLAHVKHEIYLNHLDYLACQDYQNYQHYVSYLKRLAYLYRQNCKYYQHHYSQININFDDFSNISDNTFGCVPINDMTLQPRTDRSYILSNLQSSLQINTSCEKLNAAAGYVTPYTYATLPGAAGLPAAAAAATAGAAFPGLPYQTTPQEARLQ